MYISRHLYTKMETYTYYNDLICATLSLPPKTKLIDSLFVMSIGCKFQNNAEYNVVLTATK